MEFVKNLQSFLQSYNKSLINQTCSGPYWENIDTWSFLYGPRSARSVLSRPRADILQVRPSRFVNKIYIYIYNFSRTKSRRTERCFLYCLTLILCFLMLVRLSRSIIYLGSSPHLLENFPSFQLVAELTI